MLHDRRVDKSESCNPVAELQPTKQTIELTLDLLKMI